ncbi:sugar ABC transporter permease [Jatrophihabitans telluris]|uniref:Sugar ABC transporter permease n=1 Tax=Jatrophihabitans telluris TaxID=2038343 RepID=A0ABY4QZ88_9ACTN|nr:sugar ABC transporter permease [Jatrophihabitans telluris]UQX88230.1 sugar ABC transporter permease [Jatrophihabitans telluris]
MSSSPSLVTELPAEALQGSAGLRPRRRRAVTSRGHGPTAGAFLLPNLVLVAVFLLLPLVWAFWLSMQKIGSLGPSQFLGINNYVDIIRDSVFWEALWNTALFTLLTVPVGMAVGLGMAILLNGVLPGRKLIRSIIFLPLVISGVSSGLIGAWMFDQYSGFVNNFLHALGINGPDWQSNGKWAMVSLVLVTLWIRVGFDMIIYLAGLQGVDPEYHDAAMVDGASAWQRFRAITLPLLGPSTFFLLIMNLIYSFQVFDTVYAMTNGGPNYSTTTLVTYAYKVGFDEHGSGELGYAAAIGVVIYLITLVITALNWRLSRNRDLAS